MESKRCGIYVRCSTAEQSVENQLIDLRRYAEQRGWVAVQEYADRGISGAKDRRPALDALMVDARKRKLDVVLVWKFDRFARSTMFLLNAMAEFNALGIDFCSVQDAVDTASPYGKTLFTIIGAMAELERELIRQRVLHGVKKARERGKILGRPRVNLDITYARGLHAEGLTYIEIGKRLGVSRETVRKALAINPPQNLGMASVETLVHN